MKNVGGIDKIVRIILGVGLIAWAIINGSYWAWIGIIPLITGIYGWCPIYSFLGISTKNE
jgi:Protein of unknown function (DUF2892)